MADPIAPFTPQMQSLIEQLLGSQVDRTNRTTPIHQAAMAMAARMAPGYAQSAMTGGGSGASTSGIGGLSAPNSGSGGPGVATTAAAAFVAALLKNGGNNPLMQALKGLMGGGGADPTFGGLIQGNKPMAGGTGFPDVPVTGGPNSGGMGPIPGYFQNPDGSMVGIGGDPANGGGYGGGLFPVNSNSPARGNGGGDFGPYKD